MKKLTINSDVLKPALTKLGRVVSANPSLPVLSNLFCKVTEGNVEMIGTNTDITIYCRILCEASESFEFLLPFDILRKVVSLNKHCPIFIESGRLVKITADNDTYEIKPSGKIADFPKLQELPKKNTLDLPHEVLECMVIAMATTARPDVNSKLSHVCLSLSEDKMTVASTDGHYMVYSKEFQSNQKEKEDLLISLDVIRALDNAELVKLFWHSKAIGFETPDLTVVATRSEESYVNFRKAFPDNWDGNLILNRSQLLIALEKCLLSSDPYHVTKINLQNKAHGQVKLTAIDDVININVILPGKYTGVVEETSVNAEKLQRLLNQVVQDEITLAIHDPKKAILITSENEIGYKGMIMPLAVKS